MSVLIGVLLDVSRSMELNIDGKADSDNGWIRSIFKALDSLMEHDDISRDNKIFSICVGGDENKSRPTFDLLRTLKQYKDITEEGISSLVSRSTTSLIEEVMVILKYAGALFIDSWVTISEIERSISREDVVKLFLWIKKDGNLRKKVAMEYLPPVCRSLLKSVGHQSYQWVISQVISNGLVVPPLSVYDKHIAPHCGLSASTIETTAYIKDVVKKIKTYIRHLILSKITPFEVTSDSVMNVKSASNTLRGVSGIKKELTKKEIDEFLEVVEPFIYGRTPLIQALNEAKNLFADPINREYKKFLFVLSDGDPTDKGDPPVKLLSNELHVTTISCYITQKHLTEPRRLYAFEGEDWGAEAKFMYQISSTIETQSLPRTIFVKQGWKIDIENNQTKLFVQVNHPDLINEVSDIAKNVIFCQDALSDIVSSVSLDVYINQSNASFGAPSQEGETCYANAASAVMHLAMHRIIGRQGGYPNFKLLRQEMINAYGKEGANTKEVLHKMCPRYRLQVQQVDLKGAMLAITAKRPVVATFRLNGPKWEAFSTFFKNNPSGVLTEDGINKVYAKFGEPGGHAVVLVSYDSNSLRFMNSWGYDWANNGFFRVRHENVLVCTFYDVYWTLDDLDESEIKAFDMYGSKKAQEIVNRLQSLQTTTYQCLYCNGESYVIEFSGTMEKVKCPKCEKEFSMKAAGPNIALAVYLLSLKTK